MADLIYSGPTDSANGAAGTAPGAPAAGGSRDPSQVSGQDPESFLGIPYSYSTGYGGSPPPGSESVGGDSGDPSNQPNQYPSEGTFSHVPLDGTGLDGTTGIDPNAPPPGAAPIAVSDPNNFAGHAGGGSGTQIITVTDAISGPGDWTATQSNYPPERPIIPGNFYPGASGITEGNVLVGGYKKGARG